MHCVLKAPTLSDPATRACTPIPPERCHAQHEAYATDTASGFCEEQEAERRDHNRREGHLGGAAVALLVVVVLAAGTLVFLTGQSGRNAH